MLLDERAIADLADRLIARAQARAGERVIVGIAGVPGAGKSTLAHRLVAAAARKLPGAVAAAPMDGFHLPDDVLRQRGLLDRKGAPETFDADGYIALLRRCRQPGHVERVPIYDRTLHAPRLGDAPPHRLTQQTRLIVTEGNYLLLAREPWSALATVLDETWWLDASAQRARQWLLQRHAQVGRSRAEAERRYASDRLNDELVRGCRREPGLVLRWP